MANSKPASDMKSTDPKPESDHNTFAWLPLLGLTFLFVNSRVAIYRSRDDPWSIAYIVVSLVDIVVLFYILCVFERTPRDSSKRGKLKAAVWFLTTVLTIMFSYRIGAVVPPAIAISAWGMAIAAILGGFYAFFVYQQSDIGTKDEKKPIKEKTTM